MFSEKMRWKLLLTVFVVIAILGVLLTTQTGLNFVDFVKNKISETSSFIFGAQQKSAFPAVITVNLKNKTSFYGQSYKLFDSTFTASSEYNYIKIDDVKVTVPDKKADVTIREFGGNFEITNYGMVRLSGETTYIKIDRIEMTKEKPYKIEIETPLDCSPCSFQLENLVSNIVFSSITGEVKRKKDDGTFQTLDLTNEKLDIENFNGVFQLSNESLILSGMVNQIKGEGFVF